MPPLSPGLGSRLAAVLLLLTPAIAYGQRDTVRAGAPAVRALGLKPGVDSSLTYLVRNGERRLAVTYVEEVTRLPGGFLIVGRNVRPNGVVLSLDSVAVAAGTLAPRWHADSARTGRTRVQFAGGRMRGTRVDSLGTSTAIDSAVPAGVYDYSMASRVVNLLPLRAGYTAVIATYDIHRGQGYSRVTVLAAEELAVQGRRVPTWKVEVATDQVSATRWIRRETREDVRTEVETRGMQMVVEHR